MMNVHEPGMIWPVELAGGMAPAVPFPMQIAGVEK
jgi:hypothetical protein